MNSVFVETALRPSFGIGWTWMCVRIHLREEQRHAVGRLRPGSRGAVRVISSSRSACSAREMKTFGR